MSGFLYIADDQTVDELSGRLRDGGINVGQESGRGRLKLWTRREWRQPGELDSAKKSLQIRGLIQEASKAGFKGVRFAVEMTWILGPDFTPAQLEHWEATINTLFAPSFPGRIICQYNRSRLSPEVIMAALHTHPLAVFGDHVYPNFFYQAPLILNGKLNKNGQPPAAAQVEWIIAQLKRARAAENDRVALIQKRADLAEKLQAEVVQRKRLEHEVAFASEREQLKLGQELHDGLAQHLTGIAFQISAFHETLAKVSPAQAPQAEKLEALIREGVEQARALAHGLYPVGLENRGLSAALEELACKTQKVYGVHCVVKSNQRVFDDLRGTIPLQLFRIIQEAVLNASKHGQARHVVITLAKAGRNLSVTVKDDGIGFSSPKVGESAGIGLRIMKHRASLINGKLNYRNDKDGGAVIICSIPYKPGLLSPPPDGPQRKTRSSRSGTVSSTSWFAKT